MKNRSLAALAVAFTIAAPPATHAHPRGARVTPPPVPEDIQVPAGSRAFFEGHAAGTQNYVCLPSATGFAWTLFTPDATLFNDEARQVITHVFRPTPAGDAFRPVWQHSLDSSAVWAELVAPSSDPAFVAPGAIPWLWLRVVAAQEGPTGGRALTRTAHIHRVNTSGGVAPATGCATATEVGKKALVPYTADYFFYVAPNTRLDDDE